MFLNMETSCKHVIMYQHKLQLLLFIFGSVGLTVIEWNNLELVLHRITFPLLGKLSSKLSTTLKSRSSLAKSDSLERHSSCFFR